MTHSDAITPSGDKGQNRRARVVVLGEFSAGKSTLINLLTDGNNLRTQVTATQMPPVWMSYGSDEPYRVDLNGKEHPVDPNDPDSISVSETLYIRKFMRAPLLETFDLIDTPGNSDPNIASAAWERAAELADIAIWCSASTQAWRQSELAAWRDVSEAVRARSILVLTRADKLTSDEDRAKVLTRVQREAGDHFTHIHMASLLEPEDTKGILSDLVALTNSMAAADPTIISSVRSNTASVADASPVADPIDQPSEAKEGGVSSVTKAEDTNPIADDELTDDMLIDSLDLSDDTSLDELVLNEDEDADMDEVLAALTGTAPLAQTDGRTKESSLTSISASEKLGDVNSASITNDAASHAPEMPVTLSAQGYASELWRKMSEAIPFDDPDAYEAAFDLFLEKIDAEITTLRAQLNIKAVG